MLCQTLDLVASLVLELTLCLSGGCLSIKLFAHFCQICEAGQHVYDMSISGLRWREGKLQFILAASMADGLGWRFSTRSIASSISCPGAVVIAGKMLEHPMILEGHLQTYSVTTLLIGTVDAYWCRTDEKRADGTSWEMGTCHMTT